MDGHDDHRRRRGRCRAPRRARARSGRSSRNAVVQARARRRRGRVAGSSPSAMTRRRVLLVADEVEVGELGDRVAERVVEGAERLLAAMEMDDRDAVRVAARAAAAVSKRSPTSTSASGRAARSRRADRARGAAAACTAAGGSSRRPEPCEHRHRVRSRPRERRRRCCRGAPTGACRRRAARGAGRARPGCAAHTERRIPQSWRPVVSTAIVRGAAGPSDDAVTGAAADRPVPRRSLPDRPRGSPADESSVAATGEMPGPGAQGDEIGFVDDGPCLEATTPSGGCAARPRRRRARLRPGPCRPSPSAASTVADGRDHRARTRSAPATRRDRGRAATRSRVRCFSTMAAPARPRRQRSSIPGVWSDQPTGTPNARRMVSIARRFASRGAAG